MYYLLPSIISINTSIYLLVNIYYYYYYYYEYESVVDTKSILVLIFNDF